MRVFNIIALVLVIIGGINWGFVGLFQIDVIAAIFGGQGAPLVRIIYIIVGLAAIYGIYYLLRPMLRGTEQLSSLR